ncbi:MAG TPA: hypothetical protein PLV06_14915 [Bacteroidales bacterium]|nr:hypothetical protein [Bacteroidales bacterium]
MKTLVIHPHDPTTEFLKPVYAHVPQRTVITGGVTREELVGLIDCHDRIMMMGHGSPAGLLAVGQFPGAGIFIVDHRLMPVLEKKKNSIFIWCNADHFVEYYELDGFYSGMFVSEVHEAGMMGLTDIDQVLVDQSNAWFSLTAGRHMNEVSPERICENVKREYGILTTTNPVALYNHERLFCRINN